MNLQQIRNTWMAFEQASGLGAVKDDAHYERMVALADSLVASGQAGQRSRPWAGRAQRRWRNAHSPLAPQRRCFSDSASSGPI